MRNAVLKNSLLSLPELLQSGIAHAPQEKGQKLNTCSILAKLDKGQEVAQQEHPHCGPADLSTAVPFWQRVSVVAGHSTFSRESRILAWPVARLAGPHCQIQKQGMGARPLPGVLSCVCLPTLFSCLPVMICHATPAALESSSA